MIAWPCKLPLKLLSLATKQKGIAMACCKKIYTLPSFNLVCKIYRGAVAPPGPPPLFGTSICSLHFPDQSAMLTVGTQYTPGGTYPSMYLYLPAGTDIRFGEQGPPALTPDVVEVPQNTGRYYVVGFVDDKWRGFTTAYRIATIVKCPINLAPNWPRPIP